MSNNNDGIWLKFFDCEKECSRRISEINDFFIDKTFQMKNINSEEALLKDTVFSAKRFGPQFNESDDIQKYTYRCECGHMFGNNNIAEICPDCGTKVYKREFPLSILGWISISRPVLTPIGANFIANAIGTKKTKRTVTKRGKNGMPDTKVKKDEASKWNKFLNGSAPFEKDDVLNLYNDFDRIMKPYINSDKIEFFNKNKDKMFTTKYPVLTRRLRRFMQTRNGDVDQIKTDDLSKLYISVINGSKYLDGIITPENTRYAVRELNRISLDIFEYLCNELIGTKDSNSKLKVVKGEIYSTKKPYSARLLIEPDNHLKTGRGDVCRVSYDAFRTLHKTEIAEILMNKYKYSYLAADELTDIDFVLSDSQKEVMDEILEDNEFWMIINRPPSIDFSAILSVEIMELVDEDILYINPILCGLLRGDFDGDTLSCYTITKGISKRMSVVLNPKRHTIWWDRTINDGYSVLNDQVINTVIILNDNPEVKFL